METSKAAPAGRRPSFSLALAVMQAVSSHKTLDVLSGYVREADQFKDHAGAGFL
jgi:hypothetical protein